MPANDSKVNAGMRLLSMLLDHIFMCIVGIIFAVPMWIKMFVDIFNIQLTHEFPQLIGGPLFYVALLGFSLYACKDCVNGRSPAKRILGLQVVDNATGRPASPLQCLVRDLFCFLWPVEFIMVLVNPERRIGDMVAGTMVASYNAAIEQPKIKWNRLALPVLISFAFIVLISFPFQLLQAHISKQVRYKRYSKTYNEEESKHLAQLYKDSINDQGIIPQRVEVYDKADHPGMKYISITYHLPEGYTENDSSTGKVEGAVVNYVYALYPMDSVTGQVIFVFSYHGLMNSQSVALGPAPADH